MTPTVTFFHGFVARIDARLLHKTRSVCFYLHLDGGQLSVSKEGGVLGQGCRGHVHFPTHAGDQFRFKD